jgi:hypothetical protein
MSFVFELDVSFGLALFLGCGLHLGLDHVIGICIVFSLTPGLWIRLEIGLLLTLSFAAWTFSFSPIWKPDKRPEDGTRVKTYYLRQQRHLLKMMLC